MQSSNIIRDEHDAVVIKAFALKEAALESLYVSDSETISTKVIPSALAHAVQIEPLFTSATELTSQDDTASSDGEEALDQPQPEAPSERQSASPEGERAHQELAANIPPSESDFLQEAREEAERCLTEARQKAADLEAEAYQSGFRQGVEAARQEIHQQFTSVLASFQRGIEEITSLRPEVLRLAEEDILTLACQLAKKILHHEVLSNRKVLMATLQHALAYLVDREHVVVYVNPADLEQAQALHTDLPQTLGTIRHMTIEADATIGRGGCVVESAFGEIDARLEAQFEELEHRLYEQHSLVSETDDL
jgi:flagellar assembly protein FliH